MLGHVHAFLDLHKMSLKLLKVLDVVELDLLCEVVAHLQVVSHVEQVFGELADGVLSGGVDLLLVSLHGVVVLSQLIDQLLFVLLDLFFESFDLFVLLSDQLLDLVDVSLGQ